MALPREEYEAKRIEINARLNEIRKDLHELQTQYDATARQLFTLRSDFVGEERKRLAQEAEQRSLDRD